MLLEILLQELRGFIVQLRRRAGALLRSQRLSPAGLVEVAFDRREAHAEGAGCLCLGHPASHGGDYPLSEVFRVAIHVVMLSSVHLYRNMLSQPHYRRPACSLSRRDARRPRPPSSTPKPTPRPAPTPSARR